MVCYLERRSVLFGVMHLIEAQRPHEAYVKNSVRYSTCLYCIARNNVWTTMMTCVARNSRSVGEHEVLPCVHQGIVDVSGRVRMRSRTVTPSHSVLRRSVDVARMLYSIYRHLMRCSLPLVHKIVHRLVLVRGQSGGTRGLLEGQLSGSRYVLINILWV